MVTFVVPMHNDSPDKGGSVSKQQISKKLLLRPGKAKSPHWWTL